MWPCSCESFCFPPDLPRSCTGWLGREACEDAVVARDEWSEGAEAVREGVAEAGGFRRNCFPWYLCARAASKLLAAPRADAARVECFPLYLCAIAASWLPPGFPRAECARGVLPLAMAPTSWEDRLLRPANTCSVFVFMAQLWPLQVYRSPSVSQRVVAGRTLKTTCVNALRLSQDVCQLIPQLLLLQDLVPCLLPEYRARNWFRKGLVQQRPRLGQRQRRR